MGAAQMRSSERVCGFRVVDLRMIGFRARRRFAGVVRASFIFLILGPAPRLERGAPPTGARELLQNDLRPPVPVDFGCSPFDAFAPKLNAAPSPVTFFFSRTLRTRPFILSPNVAASSGVIALSTLR